MFKLLGKEIVTGEFKGIKYNHLKLYCVSLYDSNNPTFQGQKVEILKVKHNVSDFYNDLDIGCSFKAFYDRFGNVIECSLQD